MTPAQKVPTQETPAIKHRLLGDHSDNRGHHGNQTEIHHGT